MLRPSLVLLFSCTGTDSVEKSHGTFLIAVDTSGEVPMFTWGSQNMGSLTVTAQNDGSVFWDISCGTDTGGDSNCLASPIAYGDAGYFTVDAGPEDLISGNTYDVYITGYHSGESVPEKVGQGSFTP